MPPALLPSLTSLPACGLALPASVGLLQLRFDASTLLVGPATSDGNSMPCASFPSVIGFRRMEDAELARFRQAAGDQPGWLWRVSDGGWRSEPGMYDGLLEGTPSGCQEYLILTAQEGIGVLSCGTPQVFPAHP